MAVLFSLGQYVKNKFPFCCRLWNDRVNGRNHSYGQGFQEIRISGWLCIQRHVVAWLQDCLDRSACGVHRWETESFQVLLFPYLVLALLFYVTTLVATSYRLTHRINVAHSGQRTCGWRNIGGKLLVGAVRQNYITSILSCNFTHLFLSILTFENESQRSFKKSIAAH